MSKKHAIAALSPFTANSPALNPIPEQQAKEPYNLGQSPLGATSPDLGSLDANKARHDIFMQWVYRSAAIVVAVESLTEEQEAMVIQLLHCANEAPCWEYQATSIDDEDKEMWLYIASFCNKQAAEAIAKLPPPLVKALNQWVP